MRVERAWILAFAVLLGACEREARRIEDEAPAKRRSSPDPYGDNSWAMSEGARLYTQMNYVGCHAHGGGGMGPALMDGKWRYSAEGPDVYASIMDGRPNGMPAFRPRLSEQQAWQLVAYVRSLSGLQPPSAAPGRDDHMSTGDPPARRKPLPPTKEEP